MKKDFSPEEKLLRLIKGAKKKLIPKKEESMPKMQPADNIPQLSKVAAYREGKKPKIAKFISISLPFPFKLKETDTRRLNSILVPILIFLLLYFIYDLFYTTFYKKTELKILMEDAKKIAGVKEGEVVLEKKPYSYYASSIEGRNIFMPQEVEAESVISGPTVDEIKASLSLIGIIAGDRPQAIIEDKKTRKSYFLYKGGIVGESKIVEILQDSVIMEYKGQRFELVL